MSARRRVGVCRARAFVKKRRAVVMASSPPSPRASVADARADERNASELDAWRGFTADELAVAVRVLEMCARGPAAGATDGDDARAREDPDASTDGARATTMGVLEHPKHKSLRRALLPLIERMHGKMFHGMSRREYVAAKMPKKERNRRKMAEKAADRARLDQTALRNERLRRLTALERSNALEGLGDDADVKMVARAMKVNHLDGRLRHGLEHFCFNPCRLNHAHASTFRGFAPSLNLRSPRTRHSAANFSRMS